MPAFQAGSHLQETLSSVWEQDFEDFEVIVVDDGSSDETMDVLVAQDDGRLRVFSHRRNRGQTRTFSDAVGQASGELVKPLDADDLLRRDCLRTMVDAMDAHPNAVFAFSRRNVMAERPEDPFTRRWLAKLGDLQVETGVVPGLNDGSQLLRRYLEAGMPGNWIAEPAGVIVRRADLLLVGGYSRRVRQNFDMDLWLRLLVRGPAVYIDEPLYTYRLALSGVTGSSVAGERHWLDRLWMVECLLQMEMLPERSPVLAARRRILRSAIGRTLRSPLREPAFALARLMDLAAYGGFRLAGLVRHREALAEPIEVGTGL